MELLTSVIAAAAVEEADAGPAAAAVAAATREGADAIDGIMYEGISCSYLVCNEAPF